MRFHFSNQQYSALHKLLLVMPHRFLQYFQLDSWIMFRILLLIVFSVYPLSINNKNKMDAYHDDRKKEEVRKKKGDKIRRYFKG